MSSGFTGGGAHVDEVVGLVHDRFIVFDDDEGVSFVAESVHHLGEAVDVAVVEADGGFVEDEKGVGEGGAEAGGEIDAGDFAAGKGAGRAVEGEVAEADFGEVVEARGNLVEDELGGLVERGVGFGDFLEEGGELVDGDVPEFGEGFVENPEVEGVGLEAGALAVGAGGVGAVAGEEDAHVHFVGLGFEPVEEALDAIPSFLGPELFRLLEGGERGVSLTFAVLDPVSLFGGEFVPRRFGVDVGLPCRRGGGRVGSLRRVALEGFDGALFDREKVVGDGLVEVDADDAAEAPAGGAGAEGGIETEEGGSGFAEGMPSGVEFGELELRVGNLAMAFAEAEGVFEGFGEAGLVA